MKKIILLAAAITAITACSKQSNETNTQSVAINVSGAINTTTTKASGTTWDAEDKIGIYMYEAGTSTISEGVSNRSYTTSGDGKFSPSTGTPVIYLPIDGDVDLYAYYPYNSATNNGVFSLDVTNQSDLPKIDILRGEALSTPSEGINKSAPSVNFTFSHRMTKLTLNISKGVAAETFDLTNMSVAITNQAATCDYDAIDDIFSNMGTATTAITMATSSDGTLAEAILVPSAAYAGREVHFTLADGRLFVWKFPDTKELLAGDNNVYDIILDRTGVVVNSSAIKDWNNVAGGSGTAN